MYRDCLLIRFTRFRRVKSNAAQVSSDVTNEQWARVASAFSQRRGRPRVLAAREILNAILYVMRNGCSWRALPHDFPKWQTVFAQRVRWTLGGVLDAARALLATAHEPTVNIIDSTFIESAFGGAGCAPSGYKRATGHSVHVVISSRSAVLAAAVLPANRPDVAGARIVVPAAKRRQPSLAVLLGDRAYRQRPLAEYLAQHGITVDASSPPLPKGTIFKPFPTRWRVEQFFAWFSKWRRVAKNWCFTHAGFETDVGWVLFAISLRRAALLEIDNLVASDT